MLNFARPSILFAVFTTVFALKCSENLLSKVSLRDVIDEKNPYQLIISNYCNLTCFWVEFRKHSIDKQIFKITFNNRISKWSHTLIRKDDGSLSVFRDNFEENWRLYTDYDGKDAKTFNYIILYLCENSDNKIRSLIAFGHYKSKDLIANACLEIYGKTPSGHLYLVNNAPNPNDNFVCTASIL